MCGMFGVASSERRKNEINRRDAFVEGLQVQEWRGDDATGIALVPVANPNEVACVYKKAFRASDFITTKPFEKLIAGRFDEYAYVLGHARRATYGKNELRDHTAHPFQYGPITLTHNGHIRNYHTLPGKCDISVDSAHVASALSETKDVKAFLETLEGAFAFVWHDARDGSLNFARNKDRPLYWVYTKDENTMFWGSELPLMYAVLERNRIELDGKFKHCTPFYHFKFDIKNLREPVRVPFAPAPLTNTPTQQGGSAWAEGRRRIHQTGGTHLPARSSGTAPVTSIHPLGSESPLIQTITTEFVKEVEHSSPPTNQPRDSRPTSRKRLRKVTADLARLGLTMDLARCFRPTGFVHYRNHNPIRGCIYGTSGSGMYYEVPNCPIALWEKVRGGRIFGRVSSYRNDSETKKPVVIMDFDEDLQKRFDAAYRTALEEKMKNISVPSDKVEDGENELVRGPFGNEISVRHFKHITENGCGNCSCDLFPQDAEHIMWVGAGGQFPLCKTCSNDPQVQLSVGAKV